MQIVLFICPGFEISASNPTTTAVDVILFMGLNVENVLKNLIKNIQHQHIFSDNVRKSIN